VVTFFLAAMAGAVASCAGLEVAWGSLEGCLGAGLGAAFQLLADAINVGFAIL